MASLATQSSIDYKSLEEQRSREMEDRFQQKLEKSTNLGKIDSLRHAILKYVVDSNYDMALSELHRYVEMQNAYKAFVARVQPYLRHCESIIQAVKSKRELTKVSSLTPSKQQELFEKVVEHFDELKTNLKKIEKVEREIKLDDLRTTVWVVKAFFHSLFIILAVAFVIEIVFGLAYSFNVVLDVLIDKITDVIVGLFM